MVCPYPLFILLNKSIYDTYIYNIITITIIGDEECSDLTTVISGPDSGTEILCNGTAAISTCKGISLQGTKIKTVEFLGDAVAENAVLDVDCVDAGCTVQCEGVGSCLNAVFTAKQVKDMECAGNSTCEGTNIDFGTDDSMSFSCTGYSSCNGADITVKNVTGDFSCSDEACMNSVLRIDCKDSTMCSLNCGESGCSKAVVDIDNAKSIKCDGPDACDTAKMDITVYSSEFMVQCGSAYSCVNAVMNIHIASNVTSFGGIYLYIFNLYLQNPFNVYLFVHIYI